MDYGDVLAGRANSRLTLFFHKSAPSGMAAGNIHSTWNSGGGWPAQAGNPSTSAGLTTDATTGGYPLPDLASGYYYYVDRIICSLNSTKTHRQELCDRLAHVGGYSGTSTSLQSYGISVASLDADRLGSADYSEVSWAFQWYSGTGATPVTATVTYTTGDGTSGQTTTVPWPASVGSTRLIPIIPSSTSHTIQSIESVQLSASTGTAGNFGITAFRKLAQIGCSNISGYAGKAGFYEHGMKKFTHDACLFLVLYPHSVSGTYQMVVRIFSSNAT